MTAEIEGGAVEAMIVSVIGTRRRKRSTIGEVGPAAIAMIRKRKVSTRSAGRTRAPLQGITTVIVMQRPKMSKKIGEMRSILVATLTAQRNLTIKIKWSKRERKKKRSGKGREKKT